VLELSADDDVFTFTHSGVEYEMPMVTIDDVEALSEFLVKPHAVMAKESRDFLVTKVCMEHPDTADLIGRIGLKNYFKIFRAWSGMSLGESQPSDES
jgi:hypothetical protein